MKSSRKKQRLVGLGFDGSDGHKRITQAERFTIAGGSAETHEALTATAIKTEEDLRRKGRSLETADPEEVAELIHKHCR